VNSSISILVASDGTSRDKEVDALIDSAAGLDVIEVIDNESRWGSRDSFVHHAVVVVGEGADPTLLLRLIHDAAGDPGRRPVVAERTKKKKKRKIK
jgi:hypothetical protein